MKLLICTQVVDHDDSNLGFFVRWVEEYAKHCETVTVVCLREGKHSLPENVEIIPLRHSSRLLRTLQLWRISISHRRGYDAVFVHMNPEYVLAAGVLWRVMGKRIALWYTHKAVNLRLRIATRLADIIFTASKESFRIASPKVRVMGHGIDTDFFSPDTRVARGDWLLSVGRLMPSKDHRMAIVEAKNNDRKLRIAGEGPERKNLEEYAHSLGVQVAFLGGLTQSKLRDEYREAALLIHTSKTGSLDKVVLEALACSLPIHTHDSALKSLEHVGPEYVREHHSLQKLVPAMLQAMHTYA